MTRTNYVAYSFAFEVLKSQFFLSLVHKFLWEIYFCTTQLIEEPLLPSMLLFFHILILIYGAIVIGSKRCKDSRCFLYRFRYLMDFLKCNSNAH